MTILTKSAARLQNVFLKLNFSDLVIDDARVAQIGLGCQASSPTKSYTFFTFDKVFLLQWSWQPTAGVSIENIAPDRVVRLS